MAKDGEDGVVFGNEVFNELIKVLLELMKVVGWLLALSELFLFVFLFRSDVIVQLEDLGLDFGDVLH